MSPRWITNLAKVSGKLSLIKNMCLIMQFSKHLFIPKLYYKFILKRCEKPVKSVRPLISYIVFGNDQIWQQMSEATTVYNVLSKTRQRRNSFNHWSIWYNMQIFNDATKNWQLSSTVHCTASKAKVTKQVNLKQKLRHWRNHHRVYQCNWLSWQCMVGTGKDLWNR